jgi:hypothetical protein
MEKRGPFDRFEITLAADATVVATPLRTSWREAGIDDHFVQFYREDSVLIESVAGFITAGLRTVEGGIVIATEAHRRLLEERFEAQGVDLAAARARKQYVPLDAEETLARFMVNGRPDRVLFTHVVGSVITRMVSAGFRVRAFGEMVALLQGEGNAEAAIQLEHLWNELGKSRRFALFCAYPMAHFEAENNIAGFRHVCAAHAGFIPVEGAARGFGTAIPSR